MKPVSGVLRSFEGVSGARKTQRLVRRLQGLVKDL